MSSKREYMSKKTFFIIFVSIFALAFVGMYAGVNDVHAVAEPTIIRIPNPTPQKDDLFGMAVAGIGDIDYDGIGDLIVGAPGADKVYLLSGADQSIIGIINPPNEDGYRFGYAVISIGDVNYDGIDDIAVGAPGPSDSPRVSCDPAPSSECPDPRCGRVYVFSGAGGARLRTIVPDDLDFWAFGSALASLGDIDCDGIQDIAVGAPVYKEKSLGKVYAFSGADGTQLWVTEEPESYAGQKQAIASFGAHLAGIGDVTGDGRNDLAVGAPLFDCDPDPDVNLTAGRGFILNGNNGIIFREHLNLVPTQNDNFGAGASPTGDHNGDGKKDYCFGEPGTGRLHIFSSANGSLILTIVSPEYPDNDFFGYSVAMTDDKDRDGTNNLWVGAPKGGVVYLININGEVLIELINGTPVPYQMEGGFGWSIASTEDLNNDSGLDLIIGKPAESIGWQQTKAGAVYLVLGAYVNTPPVADAGPDRTVSADKNCLATIYLDGSGSYDPDGDPLTYEWTWACGSATGVKPLVTLPLGVNVITLTVSDGMDTDTDTVVITVIDTTPPIMVCPRNIVAEQTSANGTPVNLGYPNVNDNCDDNPVVTNNAPAVFPLGTTIVTWTATDFSGNTSYCTQVVTIVDTTPPVIHSVKASPNNLWPPNHNMVPVTVTVVCKDICDIAPVCMIIAVKSSQPVNDTGDGNTAPDWVVTGDLSVNLRAERSGNDKNGRIYTITVECTDFSGNSSRANVNVIVPHDQGKKSSTNYQSIIYNSVTYYGQSSYSIASQSTSTIPVTQPQVINTTPAISVNVTNINANISVNAKNAPITVVVNPSQGNIGSKSNKAKSNTSFKYNTFPTYTPFTRVPNNYTSFGLFNQQSFLSGKGNRSFGGNNNWAFGNSMGNNWSWSQNPYKLSTNTFFKFPSNFSISVFNNNSAFNNFQYP